MSGNDATVEEIDRAMKAAKRQEKLARQRGDHAETRRWAQEYAALALQGSIAHNRGASQQQTQSNIWWYDGTPY